jgi:sec-independent protein translocase protein TatB
MFGLGFWEIIIILLAVIVLINPKEMPKIARKLGRWYRKVRNIQEKVGKEVKDFENEIRETKSGKEKNNDRSN